MEGLGLEMRDDLVEQLRLNHPHLFEKTEGDNNVRNAFNMFGIECGDGWFNILDSLFTCITSKIIILETRLQFLKEDKSKSSAKEKIIEVEQELNCFGRYL